MAPAATASLYRRIRFAASCRYRIDAALLALGMWRSFWLAKLPYATATLAFDLLEFLRTRGQAGQLGRPHLAALATSLRLPQDPRYRGYWYDADRHSLVGLHLGIDLHRYSGRYFVIESNTGIGMRPKRRRLYDGDLDPLLVRLITVAKSWKFETIILCRRWWSEAQTQEIERGSRENGIEIIAATVISDDPRGRVATSPLLALPQPLRPRTLYVIFDSMWRFDPLKTFVHDKACVGSWLAEVIAAAGGPHSRLACARTSDRIVLPSEPIDARWPNLVVKLADLDKARAVKMGRFETEDEARRELRVDDDAGDVPDVFGIAPWRKLLNRAFPGFLRPIYQPFVPPEVEEGRARKIRLHTFISPLVDTFLSAHGIIAAEAVPDNLAPGLVQDHRPYIVNDSTAGRYCRLESAIEDELRDVAEEFGRLAFRAISARFEIGTGDCLADADRRSDWRAQVFSRE